MRRTIVLFIGLLLAGAGVGAAGCEKLYRPCESSGQCTEWGGPDLRCVVSPYAGEPQGFCTRSCDAWRSDLEAGDCVRDSACGYDETEGCCHINYVEGQHGAGFCVPFPLSRDVDSPEVIERP